MSQFEVNYNPIEVTQMSLPNPSWRHTDPKGHEHRWHKTGDGEEDYALPTLEYREIVPACDEYPAIGFYACRECGQRVNPGYMSGDIRRYIQGLADYRIDGESVTKEEFERRWKEEQANRG